MVSWWGPVNTWKQLELLKTMKTGDLPCQEWNRKQILRSSSNKILLVNQSNTAHKNNVSHTKTA